MTNRPAAPPPHVPPPDPAPDPVPAPGPAPGQPGAHGRRRFTAPVDVHLVLRRPGAGGDEVLLSRRAGPVYASGLLHLPSGHLDGPHEDVIDAVIREGLEETGVHIERADVRAAVTVHHRAPGGDTRVGFFLEAVRWRGTPAIREPHLCGGMDWFPLAALPDDMVAYCRAGLDAYRRGAPMAVHFQHPGDPVAHGPGADRLHIVPSGPGGAPRGRRDAAGEVS
ncbi:NUDIX hydrolase [Streptomyces lavendofoliae]|uniref:NUDIX hydrolase n=1 Tax=Streptomyces lavendofoliae TaxID=67314 RepID=UPI003D8EE66E